MRRSREGEPGPPLQPRGRTTGPETQCQTGPVVNPGPYCCLDEVGCLESVGFGIHTVRERESRE